jgi:hypothetical protein
MFPPGPSYSLPNTRSNTQQPTNVFTRLPAVVQKVLVVAPGVLECVREDRHRAELAGVVHLASQRQRGIRAPLRGEADRAEWGAEDVAHEVSLGFCLARPLPPADPSPAVFGRVDRRTRRGDLGVVNPHLVNGRLPFRVPLRHLHPLLNLFPEQRPHAPEAHDRTHPVRLVASDTASRVARESERFSGAEVCGGVGGTSAVPRRTRPVASRAATRRVRSSGVSWDG